MRILHCKLQCKILSYLNCKYNTIIQICMYSIDIFQICLFQMFVCISVYEYICEHFVIIYAWYINEQNDSDLFVYLS